MKNLLAFTAFLAAGFLLGSRRARKAGPVSVINMAVEMDASQALSQLRHLRQEAEKASTKLAELVKASEALETAGFPRPPLVLLNEVLGCQATCAGSYRERATA